jgi:hypothetical protein
MKKQNSGVISRGRIYRHRKSPNNFLTLKSINVWDKNIRANFPDFGKTVNCTCSRLCHCHYQSHYILNLNAWFL